MRALVERGDGLERFARDPALAERLSRALDAPRAATRAAALELLAVVAARSPADHAATVAALHYFRAATGEGAAFEGLVQAAARRAAAARRPAGATAPPRAGGAVAARLATLKTETADDVLAKLRGPRRARGGRAPAPVPASPAAAPSSAAAGGGELLARLERKRGRRRKATR